MITPLATNLIKKLNKNNNLTREDLNNVFLNISL